jgi:hypothetical protein
MLISELERIIKEVFNDTKGVVENIESVYEKPKNKEDYLRLVVSVQRLTVEETIIIHTKFIFKSDLDKINIKDNYFNYLYDINCQYHTVDFDNINSVKEKLTNIIKYNKFGRDIKILSDFIDTPAKLINSYFSNNKIIKYSVTNVDYTPIETTRPCKETTFDFKIKMSNNYIFNLNIKKEDSDKYNFKFEFNEKIENVEVDNIMNVNAIIGGKLIEMMDNLIK